MTCHVCCRPPNTRLQFHCETCARNQLYPLRLEHAKVLLEKEFAGRQIDSAVTKEQESLTFSDDDNNDNNNKNNKYAEAADTSRWAIQAAHTRCLQSTARTQSIRDHLAILQNEIRQGKEEIAQRRAVIARKRTDRESVEYQLAERRAASLKEVESDVKRAEQKWNHLHNKTAESRGFLCREAANLYGLRQRTRRKNGELVSSYALGGVSIVDLRDMNNASHTHITTAISYVAHLLVLISHYLALRLPAEITLPHRGYPLPTVFPPAASYISRNHAFPGTSPSHSSSTSPTTSRAAAPDVKPLPRPRPLFLTRSLPKLAREDPSSYTLFLEGVTLLAWDVAWLCKTQGLSSGSDSWEDVCDMGRNLWQLFVAPPALTRAILNRDAQNTSTATPTTSSTPPTRRRDSRVASRNTITNSNNNNITTPLQRTSSFPKLGQYSHGSAHSFLGAAEGTEYMRTWKMPSPLKIADKLKSTLLSEMTSAEWELVEENEWEEERTEPQTPQAPIPRADGVALQVDVKHANTTTATTKTTGMIIANGDVRSAVIAKTPKEESDNNSNSRETGASPPGTTPTTPNTTTNVNGRPKGTSGWTKVKSR